MHDGDPVSWDSRRQRTVALLSTEVEYEATKKLMHLPRFLMELRVVVLSKVKVCCDNNRAWKAWVLGTLNQTILIREVLENGNVEIDYMPTEEMRADILIKIESIAKHKTSIEMLVMAKINDWRQMSLHQGEVLELKIIIVYSGCNTSIELYIF